MSVSSPSSVNGSMGHASSSGRQRLTRKGIAPCIVLSSSAPGATPSPSGYLGHPLPPARWQGPPGSTWLREEAGLDEECLPACAAGLYVLHQKLR